MTHILVKWVHADAWEVYPIRNLVDVEAGRKLIENPAYIDSMAGRVFKVTYSPSPEDSHDAFILAVGNEKNMEKQRNAVPPDVGSLGGHRVTLSDPSVTAEQTGLKEVLVELEAKNAKLEQMLDAAKMVKRLKKIIETMEETTTRNAEPAAEVDIRNDVTVPKGMLDKWRAMCPTPPRFARALLRTVLTADEL